MAVIDLKQVRKDCKLPVVLDFSGCLDGQHACNYFHGLTLEEAYQIFLEKAEIHYEDFQYFMPYAFYYYFPVIDKYWREVIPESELDELDFWHLQSVLSAQLRDKKIDPRILPKIKDLYDFGERLIYQVLATSDDLHPTLRRWELIQTDYNKIT